MKYNVLSIVVVFLFVVQAEAQGGVGLQRLDQERIQGFQELDQRKDILTEDLPSININGGQYSNITETSF